MKQEILLPEGERRASVIQRLSLTLRQLAPGKLWKITIEQYSPKRSEQQNRYLFGPVYDTLLEHLPGEFTKAELHEFLLEQCFGYEEYWIGDQKKTRPLKRSSKLNRLEFAEYIDFVQRYATRFGIFIPDAEPDWYLREKAA